jgi:hypothetical protein
LRRSGLDRESSQQAGRRRKRRPAGTVNGKIFQIEPFNGAACGAALSLNCHRSKADQGCATPEIGDRILFRIPGRVGRRRANDSHYQLWPGWRDLLCVADIGEVLTAARPLAHESDHLKTQVETFLDTVRAA